MPTLASKNTETLKPLFLILRAWHCHFLYHTSNRELRNKHHIWAGLWMWVWKCWSSVSSLVLGSLARSRGVGLDPYRSLPTWDSPLFYKYQKWPPWWDTCAFKYWVIPTHLKIVCQISSPTHPGIMSFQGVQWEFAWVRTDPVMWPCKASSFSWFFL